MTRLLEPLPPGSYLAINDGTRPISSEMAEAQDAYNEGGAIPYTLRSPVQIASFFGGLHLVEPGLVSCPRWRPAPDDDLTEVDAFGAVGRKP